MCALAAGLAYSDHQDFSQEAFPPLVLVHGAGGTRLHWPPQIRRMRAGFRVLAPDLPGHGESSGVGEETIAGYAHRLWDWAAALALPPFVLAGHSMGGAIALHTALERPGGLAGLILIGTGARLRVHPELLEASRDPGQFEAAIQQLVDWSYAEDAPAELVCLARERMAEIEPGVLHRDLLACDRFNLIERLSEIQVPTLVLCGEEDRLTPAKYSHFLAEHIPGAELRLIPRAGHMVALEQPEVVAKTIRRFMAHLGQTSPVS